MAQKTLERPKVLEGTWEEVTERAGNLSGKRVTLTVYPETSQDAEEPETLADLLAGRTGGLGFGPKDLARNHREHFARIMNAKRKEGRI